MCSIPGVDDGLGKCMAHTGLWNEREALGALEHSRIKFYFQAKFVDE
jgi:hypothetical protein